MRSIKASDTIQIYKAFEPVGYGAKEKILNSPKTWVRNTFIKSPEERAKHIGSQLSNNYFYINPTVASLTPIDFFGGDTIMIEATAIRLGVTYRDRIYVNHLGIYDNVTRLRGDVEFLDLTKVNTI